MVNIFDRLTARPESVETMDSTDEETLDAGSAAGPEHNGSGDLDRDAASAGPVSYTSRQVKDVALELLKYGLHLSK